jgi:choline monooxygenase
MSATLAEKLRGFDPNLPLERAHTIPSSWYLDPEVFAAERRAVFGGTWQAAARCDQLATAGAFVTTEIAGEPIVVLRDSVGQLRAFYNVCRHRAARVVTEEEGCATKLRCRYHGWTYDLAGRLRGAPEFEGTDFCRDVEGLVPLAVAAWGPLVWVSMHNSPGELEDYLVPLPSRAADLVGGNLRFVERHEYRPACNWKVFVDNFLDGGYHVNTVHPALAGVLDYSRYHTEIAGNTSVQVSPLKAASGNGPSVDGVRAGDAAYYWWVYPNFMINVYQGVMDTNLVLPLGPDRCRVLIDFYFDQPDTPEGRRFVAESIEVAEQVQREDITICEEVQRGLASRSYETGRFSVRREAAVYHFHRLLAAGLGAGQ